MKKNLVGTGIILMAFLMSFCLFAQEGGVGGQKETVERTTKWYSTDELKKLLLPPPPPGAPPGHEDVGFDPKHQQQAVDILSLKTAKIHPKTGVRKIEHGTNLAQEEKVPIFENLENLAVQ